MSFSEDNIVHILTIAGSDPSSGAGMQRDLKTFDALGAFGLSVITAITSQNTSKFFGVQPVSSTMVKNQIRSIISDFTVDAIKIGMVFDRHIVQAIYSELKGLDIPIVLDPVFESTTGGILLQKNAFEDFKKLLVPLSHVITPNIIEAEKLANIKIKTKNDIRNAAKKIHRLGAKNVIIKGGHLPHKNKITNVLFDSKKFYDFSHKFVKMENHGGGCTFSAVLCVEIAMGKNLPDAVKSASRFTVLSIKNATKIGKGLAIVEKSGKDITLSKISHGITQFTKIVDIYHQIPECQTNFVYSNPKPASLGDILGLEGRIVRTGTTVTPIGNLKYGGSKHVGSAVLEVSKRFPFIRSALNIKFDKTTISKAKRKGLHILSYDRSKEPAHIKKMEGSTISWGIHEAVKNTRIPPDIIFHEGGIGKEPMILIFGRTPDDVLKKLSKIV